MSKRSRPSIPDGFLDAHMCAKRWGVSTSTVRIYRYRNKGPVFFKNKASNQVLYRLADVEAWEKKNDMTELVKARLEK